MEKARSVIVDNFDHLIFHTAPLKQIDDVETPDLVGFADQVVDVEMWCTANHARNRSTLVPPVSPIQAMMDKSVVIGGGIDPHQHPLHLEAPNMPVLRSACRQGGGTFSPNHAKPDCANDRGCKAAEADPAPDASEFSPNPPPPTDRPKRSAPG